MRNVLINLFMTRLGALSGLIIFHNKRLKNSLNIDQLLTKDSCLTVFFRQVFVYCSSIFRLFFLVNELRNARINFWLYFSYDFVIYMFCIVSFILYIVCNNEIHVTTFEKICLYQRYSWKYREEFDIEDLRNRGNQRKNHIRFHRHRVCHFLRKTSWCRQTFCLPSQLRQKMNVSDLLWWIERCSGIVCARSIARNGIWKSRNHYRAKKNERPRLQWNDL